MITADAAADCGDGVSSHSENSENATNEPELDEKVFIAKPSGTVEVAANSPSIRDLTAWVRSFQGPNADTERDLGRAISAQIENSENVTNEPERLKNVIIAIPLRSRDGVAGVLVLETP
jgi:hypothetical protein